MCYFEPKISFNLATTAGFTLKSLFTLFSISSPVIGSALPLRRRGTRVFQRGLKSLAQRVDAARARLDQGCANLRKKASRCQADREGDKK
jgi:hypothetical protein